MSKIGYKILLDLIYSINYKIKIVDVVINFKTRKLGKSKNEFKNINFSNLCDYNEIFQKKDYKMSKKKHLLFFRYFCIYLIICKFILRFVFKRMMHLALVHQMILKILYLISMHLKII